MDRHNFDDEAPDLIEHPQQHAVRELFPAYATTAALSGQLPDTDPALQAHLAVCAACRAELSELVELTTAAYTGQIARAPAYPPADLSFLPGSGAPPAHGKPWLLDALGRLMIEFSEALIGALAPPALAGAARGQFLFRYIQDPGSVQDLEVTIDVFAEDAARTLGRVRVGVDVPSRGAFDQSGNQVTVRAGEAVWQGQTDETGSVDLAPIPLDAVKSMRVEIIPNRN